MHLSCVVIALDLHYELKYHRMRIRTDDRRMRYYNQNLEWWLLQFLIHFKFESLQ